MCWKFLKWILFLTAVLILFKFFILALAIVATFCFLAGLIILIGECLNFRTREFFRKILESKEGK